MELRGFEYRSIWKDEQCAETAETSAILWRTLKSSTPPKPNHPSFVIFPTSLALASRLSLLRLLNANVNRHDILHSRIQNLGVVDEIFINNACECLD